MSEKQIMNLLRMVGVKLDAWEVKMILDQVSFVLVLHMVLTATSIVPRVTE